MGKEEQRCGGRCLRRAHFRSHCGGSRQAQINLSEMGIGAEIVEASKKTSRRDRQLGETWTREEGANGPQDPQVFEEIRQRDQGEEGGDGVGSGGEPDGRVRQSETPNPIPIIKAPTLGFGVWGLRIFSNSKRVLGQFFL